MVGAGIVSSRIPAGYAVKLAVALGESPGREGVERLLDSLHDFSLFLDLFSETRVAAYAPSVLRTPRDVEVAARRWAALRISNARLYAGRGLLEDVARLYELCIVSRDVSLLLRAAVLEESVGAGELLAGGVGIVSRLYEVYERSRFLPKLLEAIADAYPVIPEALRFYRESVDLETAVGLAVDEQLAVLLSTLASRSPLLRRLLCPRLDTLYARLAFNTALKGLTGSPARRLLASLRPCLLPRVDREALRGDADIVAERLSSTPYGPLEARGVVDAAAELEALIARRARSIAVQGVATNPLTIRYAIAAHEHILLDVRDLTLLANASRHGLPKDYAKGRLSYSL